MKQSINNPKKSVEVTHSSKFCATVLRSPCLSNFSKWVGNISLFSISSQTTAPCQHSNYNYFKMHNRNPDLEEIMEIENIVKINKEETCKLLHQYIKLSFNYSSNCSVKLIIFVYSSFSFVWVFRMTSITLHEERKIKQIIQAQEKLSDMNMAS